MLCMNAPAEELQTSTRTVTRHNRNRAPARQTHAVKRKHDGERKRPRAQSLECRLSAHGDTHSLHKRVGVCHQLGTKLDRKS